MAKAEGFGASRLKMDNLTGPVPICAFDSQSLIAGVGIFSGDFTAQK
jgi:hypothetical protein